MANQSKDKPSRKTNPQRLFEIDGRSGLWSVPAWCAQFGITEPTYYALDPQPHRAKLGRVARITESPRDYAERVRRAQMGEH